ncbi:metalloenzyme domain protein [Deinococcus koreensis]|uniref:Metalloenzyme domain protein n=1 Tax=Deinococcus koreensis TaxID=2054903 RepID=A0A2K3UXN4_9DEIO|nr:metalloenzyme domain protein [Deinococcus koreensis]PNY81302.1 metalloenzyme domain protein [Deinococcus koreensis]
MSGLVWLALDGVGHPRGAPPGSVWEQPLPTLRPLIDAGLALDATLGVPGLPQSGTGQTCWLTGLDAVAAMGEHFGPQPGPTLQRLLSAHSLPRRLAQAGGRVALVNEYAPQYFAAQLPAASPGAAPTRNRLGCFPFAFRGAGLPLNPPGLPLVRASLGLGFRPPWTPVQPVAEVARVGAALAGSARDHDLLVADLWFSDLLGHEGRDPTPPGVQAAGLNWLARLDALLEGLLEAGARVVISSDHGNFENLGVKAHTLARVPFAGVGVNLGQPRDIVEGGRVLAGWFGLGPVADSEF